MHYIQHLEQHAKQSRNELIFILNPHKHTGMPLSAYVSDLREDRKISDETLLDALKNEAIWEVTFTVEDGYYFAYSSDLESACKQLWDEINA